MSSELATLNTNCGLVVKENVLEKNKNLELSSQHIAMWAFEIIQKIALYIRTLKDWT